MIGVIRGVITVVLMGAFIGLVIWAWSNRRKEQFDSMARMPLEDEQNPPSGGQQS
jgi:cytochrome c oxidase cbb3-type subunit IV